MVNLAPYLEDSFPYDAARFQDMLEGRELFVVGISGKKGSGKDTFGELFRQRASRITGLPMEQMAFANELKNEASALINQCEFINELSSTERDEAVLDLAKHFRFDISHAVVIADRLRTEPRGSNGWTRSENVWWLLRYLGTDIRQSQDRIYWVKTAMWNVAKMGFETGSSPVFTDVRFLHEAQFIRDVGGYLIRVDVSPETQRRRLMGRDGLVPTPEALAHPSETQLDDYDDFNQRVDNNVDGALDSLVDDAVARWSAHYQMDTKDAR